ncbi:MAG TPA: DUF86 domain-containing protein [Nitrospirae bacterium]|nr:DUF86 domain-containing protein [Nitrospirota bacterium]
MSGLRNVIAHEYFGIDLKIILTVCLNSYSILYILKIELVF